MSIDKQQFHEALLATNKQPDDKYLANEACKQLISLAGLLANKFQVKNRDDVVQEVAMRSWNKRQGIDTDKGNAFNLFWTVMRNDMFKVLKKQQTWSKRNYLFSGLKYEPQVGMDEEQTVDMENYILEKLDLELGNYKDLEAEAAKMRRSRTGRRRSKTDQPAEFARLDNGQIAIDGVKFAAYVCKAYDALCENKSISESDMLSYIPDDKHLKDPVGYVSSRFKIIAKAQGLKVKKFDGVDDKTYVIVDPKGSAKDVSLN